MVWQNLLTISSAFGQTFSTNRASLAINNFYIYAADSQIRAINLSAIKKLGLSKPPPQDCPYIVLAELNSYPPISQILANSSHKLIAFIASGSVHLIPIDIKKWILASQNNSSLPIETPQNVGPLILPSSPLAIQLQWHPLSSHDSHLVVLYEDSSLRMFDLLSNIQSPEQTAQINKNSGSAFNRKNIVSFSISASKEGWEHTATYLITDDCDIYVLSPFLPKKSKLSKNWISNIWSQTEIELNELKAEQYSSSRKLVCPPELQDAIYAYEWADSLYYIASKQDNDNTTLNVILTDDMLGNLHFQGPFLLKPSPPEVISNNTNDNQFVDDVSDLLVLSTFPATIIAAAKCSGIVDLFAVVEQINPSWELKYPELALNSPRKHLSLLTLESINFNSTQIGPFSTPTTLAPSIISDNSFFVGCPAGVYKVSTLPWINEFSLKFGIVSSIQSHDNIPNTQNQPSTSTNFEGNDVSNLLSNLSITNSSENKSLQTSCIVDSLFTFDKSLTEFSGRLVSGISEVTDIYISYSVIVLLQNNICVAASIPLLEENAILDKSLVSKVHSSLENTNLSNQAEYKPKLYSLQNTPTNTNEPFFIPEAAMSLLTDFGPSKTKKNSPNNAFSSTHITEESLHELGSFATKLRFLIQTVVDSNSEMYQCAEMQIKEFERQKEKLKQIAQLSLVSSSNQFEKALYRLIKIQSMQEKLADRTEKILMDFSDYQTNLGIKEEEQVYKRLKSIESKISTNYNSFQERLSLISSTISTIKQKSNNIVSTLNIETPINKEVSPGYGIHLLNEPEHELDTDLINTISEDVTELRAKIRNIEQSVNKFGALVSEN
ncbi:hypothetical protein BB559_001667 [Furculomyces boomerangus]|uniref:Uncharacterized protein n=2 Tax=Harpellales TaxID=61421 RepID=A0A2T9Z176_9FUNG|nr:hypothetical protein BB559_001667 [Furculomyces boomerangus]PWA00489.1 hypothetical protein BB558_003453 [Smittium angustum]